MADLGNLYKSNFDSKDYAYQSLQDTDYEHKWVTEDFLHKLFSEGKLRGKTLLDVGCGPTVRAAISASAFVQEIYLSDFLVQNRTQVQKWVENASDALDYSDEFKHVAQLEGQSDYKVLEQRARAAVKEVLPCDILADDSLYPRPRQQFDIVTSFLCLDCFPDDKDYFLGMRNLANLVKPGGHLVLTAANGCSKYTVGGIVLPSALHDVDSVSRAVAEANLKICEINDLPYKKPVIIFNSDNKGMITVLAAKP